MKKLLAVFLTTQIALFTGCATTSEESEQVSSLRQQLDAINTSGGAKEYAPIPVQEAREAIDKLQEMAADGADEEAYDHQLYLTEKKVEIAKEMVSMEKSEEVVANSESRRKDVLLDAQKREVANMRSKVNTMAEQASRMEARAQELQAQVQDLEAQETERGLVLTLGSVLFQTGKSTLQSGAQRTVEKVADFLNEYPEREILIEGFTDNVGDQSYNEQLSQARAEEVKRVLTNHGVDSARIKTEGYGEEFPVANNSTEAGRQQNRRVEIVVGNDNGVDVSNRTSMRE